MSWLLGCWAVCGCCDEGAVLAIVLTTTGARGPPAGAPGPLLPRGPVRFTRLARPGQSVPVSPRHTPSWVIDRAPTARYRCLLPPPVRASALLLLARPDSPAPPSSCVGAAPAGSSRLQQAPAALVLICHPSPGISDLSLKRAAVILPVNCVLAVRDRRLGHVRLSRGR